METGKNLPRPLFMFMLDNRSIESHILAQANTRIISVMDKFPITAKGFIAMEAELKKLKTVERPNIIKAIAEARAHGDLSENAEYSAAREKQSFIEGRILELESRIAGAEVIDVSKLSGDVVKFGATVVLIDEDTGEKVTY